MALLFSTIRHHSSSSVFLTNIIYSADFCYLVTAQERTGNARQWYTRRRAPRVFPSRATFFIEPIMISTWYFPAPASQATRSLHWLCRRLKKQNIDRTINSTDSSILNRPGHPLSPFTSKISVKREHGSFITVSFAFRKGRDACVGPGLPRDLRLPSFGCLTMIYYEIGSKRSSGN